MNQEMLHFFEDEFPMKNIPSTSSHDSVSFETPKPVNIVADESHENIREADNGVVTQKSKRRRCLRKIGTSRKAHSKPKGAGLTRVMNPESVPVNFPETDKGIKIVR
jgi:hypothetical protein